MNGMNGRLMETWDFRGILQDIYGPLYGFHRKCHGTDGKVTQNHGAAGQGLKEWVYLWDMLGYNSHDDGYCIAHLLMEPPSRDLD
jgi:hypothetical protein